MQEKIKLVSGWSNPGGSTIHHINLTNLLNANGYDCTFYGPHDWHLDKCKSGTLAECSLNVYDTVISHFIKINTGNIRNHILSCHETNLFPLKEMDLAGVSMIHFVSNFQKKWHSINHPSVIIPGVIDKIQWTDPKNEIAGVIGSIDSHKQPHLSIERALEAGYKKVRLYGQITELPYYSRYVRPYIEKSIAIYTGHEDDKTKMYNTVCAVFSSSKRECLPTIQGECLAAGIPFFGLKDNMRDPSDFEFDNQVILEKWKAILD